jgi:ABC-type transport system involved in cytochrome c biogenesis permease subunit
MTSAESVFFWAATVTLAATFFLSLLALTFSKRWAVRGSLAAVTLTLALLTVFGILRWTGSGHPPFVTIFESMTISVWFSLLIFSILRWLLKQGDLMLLPLAFAGFLLLGWASSTETAGSDLSQALDSVWLFIHASFATCGAATFVLAASFSAVFLLGEAAVERLDQLGYKGPRHARLPKTILNLTIFGLVLWGVMIVSGSIWANAAWGRYWAWDPIELWSLISWLLYALILHARLAFKMSQRSFSWLSIAAALTVVFALWGVGYLYETIHNYG